MAKKQKKENKVLDVLDEKKPKKENSEEKKSSKINDGKCCRCIHRKEKKCNCTESKKYKKYVPRKGTCKSFKYDE